SRHSRASQFNPGNSISELAISGLLAEFPRPDCFARRSIEQVLRHDFLGFLHESVDKPGWLGYRATRGDQAC
ncbi:MAG: hypothetical protein MO852_07645, partial [Candidatus Devosia euplotis]|nr:hypothetical protein [Candidatus Devosia euplotis]